MLWLNNYFLKVSEFGHLEIARLLIENKKFDCINEKDKNSRTSLNLGKYFNNNLLANLKANFVIFIIKFYM